MGVVVVRAESPRSGPITTGNRPKIATGVVALRYGIPRQTPRHVSACSHRPLANQTQCAYAHLLVNILAIRDIAIEIIVVVTLHDDYVTWKDLPFHLVAGSRRVPRIDDRQWLQLLTFADNANEAFLGMTVHVHAHSANLGRLLQALCALCRAV